jgi:hypothetical protein
LTDSFTRRCAVLSTALDTVTAADSIKTAHGSRRDSTPSAGYGANQTPAGCLCLTNRTELVFWTDIIQERIIP